MVFSHGTRYPITGAFSHSHDIDFHFFSSRVWIPKMKDEVHNTGSGWEVRLLT